VFCFVVPLIDCCCLLSVSVWLLASELHHSAMSELSSAISPSPIQSGKEIRRLKRQQRRSLKRQSGVSPRLATPTKADAQKYTGHGLPSLPKNPMNGKTVPYDTAVERVENGLYGDDIRDEFKEGDPESVKRILFLAGRDFGDKTWSPTWRDEKMLELVELCEGGKHTRFKFLVGKPGDRDLLSQTIGAENDEDHYINSGQASGKTYKQCYGEQIVAILRYVQQNGAFGFLSDEEISKLVFFFRFNLFGTCYLAAVCVLASYLGQMAFKLNHVTCPPDVGKLIRSFKDQDLYDYIVKDQGGDSRKVLSDMLERLGKSNVILEADTETTLGDDDGYDLEKRFRLFGPGLVTGFKCTEEFQRAWVNNPAWQSNGRNEDKATVGFIQFDMQDGQDFESVKGEFKELKPPRGTDNEQEEITLRLQVAENKVGTNSSLFDHVPRKTMVGSPNVGGGDRSAHTYSPQSSPDSIKSSPRHDRTATSHNNADMDDSRDLDDESIEALRDGESNQLHFRDRPPVVEDDEKDESESQHAMVCVAGRRDKKSKKLFLFLQNSWSRMPFVEVSLNYLVAAGAALSFVSKKDHEFFKQLGEKDCFYEVNKAFVADCSSASYSGPSL